MTPEMRIPTDFRLREIEHVLGAPFRITEPTKQVVLYELDVETEGYEHPKDIPAIPEEVLDMYVVYMGAIDGWLEVAVVD